MPVTVKGVYRRGTVTLWETPRGLREGPVEVTLREEAPSRPAHLQYGKYAHGTPSTEEDFRIAEWRGEEIRHGT